VLRLVVLLIILAGYVFLQRAMFTPAYNEPDCDGYIVLAKRMARGGPIGVVDSDPFLHQTHVWVENDRGEVLPKFAPGYPALMAIAYKISGGNDEAMFLISPIAGGLALIGAYLLFRLWVPDVAAILATIALAINTSFEFYASYMLTHVAEVCFVTWGVYLLLRWMRRDARSSRGDVCIAIAAGLTLGYACSIRHTSALLALAVIAAIIVRVAREVKTRSFRVAPLIALVIAYAIVPTLMMLYDWRFFGSPFRTGYDLSNEQFTFTWGNFTEHAAMLARGLNYELLFLLFPLGLIGMLFFGAWGERVVKLLWFVPLFVAYAAYYWAVGNMAYYRFLFPVVPLFVGCAFLLMDRIAVSRGKRWAIMLAVLGVLLWNGWPQYVRWLGLETQDPARPWRVPQTIAGNNPHTTPRIDAARGLSDAVHDDDAVIFAADQAVDGIGVRRNFRTYPLRAFIPERGADFQHDYDERNPEPRMQVTRRKRLIEYYKSETREDLHASQMQLIEQNLKAGREVVFFVPIGQLPPMPANLQGVLVKQFQTRGWGPWGVYDVKSKTPATTP
jgi:4-amino-4-deoxy-L-arabinose transferase-like glycosyltransferase